MKVVHLQRKPSNRYFSIERVFAQVRDALPHEIQCTVHVSPFLSQGILPRAANLRAAARQVADIHHITGDVHYLAFGLRKATILLTIHDCVSIERLRGFKRAIFTLLWYQWPIQRSANVTVVSESTKRELLRYVRCDPARIRVIPDCVGREFVPAPKPFNSAEPEILHVGTSPNKNLERVLEAVSELPCRLKVIGPLSAEQRALLNQSRVRYHNAEGLTDTEVVRVYQDCDLLLFASTYEGFGLPILEAQATGRPVIASNLLSMPEVAGSGARFVDPLNVASIRQALLEVIRNETTRQQLVSAGYENVKRFSPAAVAKQYADLYEELWRRGGGSRSVPLAPACKSVE